MNATPRPHKRSTPGINVIDLLDKKLRFSANKLQTQSWCDDGIAQLEKDYAAYDAMREALEAVEKWDVRNSKTGDQGGWDEAMQKVEAALALAKGGRT